MPPELQVVAAAGDMPTPAGGKLADGIYDLIATRAYADYLEIRYAEVFSRAAMRFSANGTQVEQIYDADPSYFADADSRHRLMTVATEGNVLHFAVTCPDLVIERLKAYDRGFSVQGSELWLFQPSLIQVYRLRQ